MAFRFSMISWMKRIIITIVVVACQYSRMVWTFALTTVWQNNVTYKLIIGFNNYYIIRYSYNNFLDRWFDKIWICNKFIQTLKSPIWYDFCDSWLWLPTYPPNNMLNMTHFIIIIVIFFVIHVRFILYFHCISCSNIFWRNHYFSPNHRDKHF